MNASDPQRPGTDRHPPTGPAPLVTHFELSFLGQFTRYQDIARLLAGAGTEMPVGYPLFPTRIRPSKEIDLLIGSRWEQVEYVAHDRNYIRYRKGSIEGSTVYSKYCVAPVGLYTRCHCDISAVDSGTLSNAYKRPSGAFVTRSEIQSVCAPYVTFRIDYADGRGSSGWDFETFHIADPRVQVDGVTPRQPFYNSPIAVSHRWLSENHPDPNGIHFREFLTLCEKMGLLDCQTFFIDYCSLPQSPRTPEEDALLRRQLKEVNSYYQESTIILVEEADDYETRAWCMFEMILSAVRNVILNRDALEGKLKAAFDLARSFVDASRASFEGKSKFGMMPGRTISPRQFSKWAHGSLGLNRVYHEMRHRNRESILTWFHDHGLKSTNMEDIPVIVGLLEELM